MEQAIPEGKYLDIVIYDNSPESQDVNEHDFKRFNINYISNTKNPGVSEAYNHGAKIARESNKKWILILDQDTKFNKEIFSEYWKAIQTFEEVSLFAPILKIDNDRILSPCKFKYYGRHLKSVNTGVQSLSESSPINSGMLINTDAFHKVGGYNEKVQLDISDHQFIERFRKEYKDYVVVNSTGSQNFSAIDDNKKNQIIRFRYYCNGIYSFETADSGKKSLMELFLLFKTIKKTIKYRSLAFIQIFANQFLK